MSDTIIGMKKQSGFTVIELVIVVILLMASGILFVQQKSQIQKVDRDRERKTAINAFYYSLEEVYYKSKGNYPRSISKVNLPSVEPDLFKDPNGKTIGEQDSNYRYDPINCEADVCKSYILRAELESENDYTKESIH